MQSRQAHVPTGVGMRHARPGHWFAGLGVIATWAWSCFARFGERVAWRAWAYVAAVSALVWIGALGDVFREPPSGRGEHESVNSPLALAPRLELPPPGSTVDPLDIIESAEAESEESESDEVEDEAVAHLQPAWMGAHRVASRASEGRGISHLSRGNQRRPSAFLAREDRPPKA
jgi:hypothetical protein